MNTGRIISILLIVVMGAGLAFFAVKYMNERAKSEEKELNIENLTAEIEDLETDIEEYKTDLENKDLDLEEKERLLQEKEQLLLEKQRKIDQMLKQNKITAAEAAELRTKVEQLDYYLKQYREKITELEAKVTALEGTRDTLIARTDSLGKVVRDRDEKIFVAETLINSGKILSARPFYFYRKKSSGKAIEAEEFRRGQMDDFKVCFDIAENRVADPGKRTAYVQMIDPKGEVVQDQNGGTFKNYSDQTITYSAAVNFSFERIATNICMDFPTPAGYEYEKGKHVVKVWCEGYDIGQAEFTVR